jgi:hypothetical protein
MVLGKKENLLVLLALFILAATITFVQYHKWTYSSSVRADTGFLLEMTENIANGEGDKSSIYAAMNNFFGSYLQVAKAEDLCNRKLGKVSTEFRVVTDSHKYYITYIVAVFSKFFDIKALYYTIHVFGFFLMLYIVYRILRENHINILPASLFTILVFVHPAFSLSMSGQLYAERMFIPFAMIFLYLLNKKEFSKASLVGLYSSGFLLSLVSERAPVMMGIFIFLYICLFWKKLEKRKKVHLVTIGGLLLFYAWYSLKAIAETMKDAVSNYLPKTIEDLLYRFVEHPTFLDNLIIFGIFSFLFLGIFTVFRWRLLLLALVMMLPNIFGDIGGAEKTGYYTHYHSLYFPFLVFVAALGYIKMVDIFKESRYSYTISIAMIGLILLSLASSPYNKNISTQNMIVENPILRDINLYPDIFNKNSSLRQYLDGFNKINDLIPEGSIVTASESGQVLAWKNKTNYYYPMGIDIADYAVLYAQKTDNGYKYAGVVSYLGNEEAEKINRCMQNRMVELGYDFKNQIIINDFAIIKRNK